MFCFCSNERNNQVAEKISSSSAKTGRRKSLESKVNETIVKDLDRPSSEMNLHHSNTLRNSFILEEEEEMEESDRKHHHFNQHQLHHEQPKMTTSRSVDEVIEEEEAIGGVGGGGVSTTSEFEKKFELPFPELVYINLADNQVFFSFFRFLSQPNRKHLNKFLMGLASPFLNRSQKMTI